ncbi:MAG: hypothetical protein ACOZQL_31535 [Myxococcota bacterium]
MRRALLVLVLSASGCLNNTPPELAPEAIDENLRWFWVHGDAATDAELIDAAGKLSIAGKADTRTTALKGGLRRRLEAADIAPFGLTDTDPSTARGLLVVNLFDCSLGKLENILIAQDQASQYLDVYKSYTRTYTTDADAFRARTSDVIQWTVDVKAALPVEDVYTSTLKGGVRRVKAPAESATKGDFLVARTWLTAPATFVANSGNYFKQDYQLEVFWEQAPGRIFHAYAMWRDIKAVGLTIEDDGFMNLVLDNLVKWDDRTAELCKKP